MQLEDESRSLDVEAVKFPLYENERYLKDRHSFPVRISCQES